MPSKKKTPATKRDAPVRNRALAVIARMRRTGKSLAAASHDENIDPRTVKKYVGAELKTLADGSTAPTKTDLRQRNMLVPTSRGAIPVVVRGSHEASQLGRYMSAVGHYLKTGNTSALQEFEGQSIGGHRLITDLSTLSHLAEAGSLQLDSIYALSESSS